jgi:SAM-dependent methyltransferase
MKKVKNRELKVILLCVLLLILFVMNRRYVNKLNNYVKKEHFTNQDLIIYREKSYKQMELVEHVDDIHARLFEIVINNYEIFQFEIDKIKKYTKMDEDSKVLDAGCGFGFHINIIKKDLPGITIEGIDISNNMLKRAIIRNPGCSFVNDDLLNSGLYKEKVLSHILCLHDTLNHNTAIEIKKILHNFKKWLVNDGYLCLHIFDDTILDPGVRPFSQYYKGKDNVRHSLTYFEAFTHDAWWERDPDRKYWYRYCEKYIFPKEQEKIKTTDYWIPPKKDMLKYITDNGFKLLTIIHLDELEIKDFSIYIFTHL